ncbi:MAG: thrombospondin type 3 repeat-containing protein, partial [Pseudomonadales bacterium]
SESFELLVVTPLRITDLSRSPSDGQVDQGGTFSLTVSAEGTGSLSYQWEAQILRADWALIEGATDSAYSVINATRAEHQGNYRVTVSDDNGSLLSERTLRIEVSQTTSGGGGTADDSDGDGIANGADNCPDVANLAQNDMNGDGEGDACDDDIDGDGAFNDEEAAAGTDPEDPESFPDDSGQSDRDGDGVEDDEDAFPLDASESLDTDSDGIGNNADLDDDNDNFTDEEELADGTDPLNRFSCRSGCFSFDVDESLKAQPLTDGLIVIRHLFGFSGDSLTSGAIDASAKRGTSELISTYLTNGGSELDIDGNGASEPLTDGLLLIRYLFGFSNDALISGAIGSGAERDTAEKVGAYIQDRVPEH